MLTPGSGHSVRIQEDQIGLHSLVEDRDEGDLGVVLRRLGGGIVTCMYK